MRKIKKKVLNRNNVYPVTIEVAVPIFNKDWAVLTMVNVKQSEFKNYQKKKRRPRDT